MDLPFSHNTEIDILSDAHFAELQNMYLRAIARKDDTELYAVVSHLRYRIQRALSNRQADNKPLTAIISYEPIAIPFASSQKPTELTKKYWSLDNDLAKVELKYSNKPKTQDFKYVDDLEKLKALFEQVKYLFRPNTNENNFIHIFFNLPDNINWEPLKLKANTNLLAYFLDAMCKRELIDKEWQSIAGNGRFFISKKDNVITNDSLSQCKSRYEKLGNPQGHEIIDKVLSSIYSKKVQG